MLPACKGAYQCMYWCDKYISYFAFSPAPFHGKPLGATGTKSEDFNEIERGVQLSRLESWTSCVRGRRINHCAIYNESMVLSTASGECHYY